MGPDSEVTEIRGRKCPIVTTTRRVNGAIVMFCPGIKEKIAELAGGSYYVVFTGIHEPLEL